MHRNSLISPRPTRIRAFGRLHFGLVNLSLYGERINGGAGAMISPPAIEVYVNPDSGDDVVPAEWINEVMFIRRQLEIHSPTEVHIKFDDRMRWHIGLGFHTQLRLAIAAAFAFAYSLPIDPYKLSQLMSRGGTSGIGVHGFWHGGLLFDGGRTRPIGKLGFSPSSSSIANETAPLLFHRASLPFFPVIALGKGWPLIFGDTERQLFSELTPIPNDEAANCARAVYMDLQAAAAEANYQAFCEAITALTRIGFKKREISYRGTLVSNLMGLMQHIGLDGVSMSSWGPTCFGFTRDPDMARHAADRLKREQIVEDAWTCEFAPGASVECANNLEISALELAMQNLSRHRPTELRWEE